MELGLRDGKLVWIKADGTASIKLVGAKSTIIFYGFPEPPGESIQILEGDPSQNEIILVKASSNSWWGTLLLSKTTGECVKVDPEDIDYAKTFIDKSPKGGHSLTEVMELRISDREEEKQIKRDAVDLEVLAQERGLAVWKARDFEGYWCREYGEFNEMPEDWMRLPKGDAALTQRVRKGPHWILMSNRKRKNEYYNEAIGTIAPIKNIEQAFNDLGGEEKAMRRQKGKKEGQRKREELMTEKFKSAITRSFPKMPEKDISAVLEMSRRQGAVGTAQWLYFSMAGADQSFDEAAYLAVQAHARHQYTDYDQILSDLNVSIGYGDTAKKEARGTVADRIGEVLNSWQ